MRQRASPVAQANVFTSFADLATAIGDEVTAKTAVLDGEIVALDSDGCSQFNQLLFRRGTPRFCAFDVLFLNGRDLRTLPLVERKRTLRSIVPKVSKFMLSVDHVDAYGERLFELVCERDLEGIVAKPRGSRYEFEDGNPAWVKIKNRNYSQIIGRHALFEREPEATYHAAVGWDSCSSACQLASPLSV